MRLILVMAVLGLSGCGAAVLPEPVMPDWQKESVTSRIVEPESEAAQMVPADARWYVRIDGLAGWLDEGADDPLVGHLWNVMRTYQPPELWKRGAEKLGFSDAQVLRAYFARSLAVVDQKVEGAHGVVVMTRAEEPELRAFPGAMGLSPHGVHPRIGPFEFFTGTEGEKEYTFAVGRRWLMVTESKYEAHLRRLICAVAGGEKPLSDSETFHGLLAGLPSERDGVILVREPGEEGKPDDCHALTIVRQGRAITVDYAAQAPKLAEQFKEVQEVPGVDFGPAPDSTILAATVSVMQRDIPGSGLLNMFLFPRNFKSDVRPGISPPMVVFLASLPAERVEPNPGVSVPVMGVAIRLTDPAVARDLDRIVRGVHFLLTATRLDLASGFFGVKRVQRDGLEYHVADFGPAIQGRIDDPSVKRLANLPSSAGLTSLSFGRVGDDYLICSQEAFLHEWRRARENPALRLTSAPEFERFALVERPHLLVSFVTRAPRLGALLHEVADYWKKAKESGQVKEDPDAPRKREPAGPKPDEVEQPLRWVADGLRHRDSFSLQLWRDEAARLYGKLKISAEGGAE